MIPSATQSHCSSDAPYRNRLGRQNQLLRVLWNITWLVLYRPSPVLMHGWRRALLRAFGAKVGRAAHPYPRCQIWAPWNLTMGDHSCLADHVDCYSVAPITLGEHATVSQYSFLCGATHDYEARDFALIPKPIWIGANAWLAADVFVAPGVRIGAGAVVGARSSVYKDVPEWTVVVGNPARALKQRVYRSNLHE